jgi:hypothetical protein
MCVCMHMHMQVCLRVRERENLDRYCNSLVFYILQSCWICVLCCMRNHPLIWIRLQWQKYCTGLLSVALLSHIWDFSLERSMSVCIRGVGWCLQLDIACILIVTWQLYIDLFSFTDLYVKLKLMPACDYESAFVAFLIVCIKMLNHLFCMWIVVCNFVEFITILAICGSVQLPGIIKMFWYYFVNLYQFACLDICSRGNVNI